MFIAHLCVVSGFWKSGPQGFCSACGNLSENTDVEFESEEQFNSFASLHLAGKIKQVKKYIDSFQLFTPTSFATQSSRDCWFFLKEGRHLLWIYVYDTCFVVKWTRYDTVLSTLEEVLSSKIMLETKISLISRLDLFSDGIHSYDELV